ncbi:hypothetical protein F5Y00DRAFT_198153 [Daldinia vernicosa]|uniref:uncharacterized protein n=1 Tax=Daldinia vernicosa TaxID=114800 RepID=UPI002008805C|nr:uncharacterized protein F5Y00DRAFT_198153 [Daldinia vernicosa]KAI0844495.1 hypothetical protein F5Y00DRAFT_198153 [Daldinia vernicosa]
MQTLIYRAEQSNHPLGQRRGLLNLANFSLDLSWARAETDCALSSTRAYPSPPMSGSPPPLPPKSYPEVGDRGQGSFQPTSHDAYRPSSTVPGGEYRAAPPQPSLLPPTTSAARSYPQEAPERMPYPYHRPEDTMGRPISYAQQPGPMVPQPQYSLPPVVGPNIGPSSYPMPSNPQGAENPPYASPKSQRKTKGHVASACVPCKRAHLRCDAQRPCSRCLSNGKEDSCVDVQHKKRGRPRLRDDNQPRFETGRFPHPGDPTAIRRPVSLYSPISAVSASYEDPLRRNHSYRVLKSQPSGDSIPPRFIERGSTSDANIFPAPISIPPRAQEPVAFLTTDLEIMGASGTFMEAVGVRSVMGRRLLDVVSPGERDRVFALQRSLQDEQGKKEPNYLPPIFGKEEAARVIQALPFSPESISRFQLDRHDFFNFVGGDGQSRPYPIRVGLAKEDSIYFVVLLLLNRPAQPFPHPSPSPHARDFQYSFQQPYAQLTPISGSFDSIRPRYGESSREGAYTPRQPPTPAPIASGLTPGISPNVSSYSASIPSRIDPPAGPSHHIPRSELPVVRPPQQVEYQLPPIRGQSQAGPPGEPSSWQRDDRSSRVDIGGLIEKPDPSRRGR